MSTSGFGGKLRTAVGSRQSKNPGTSKFQYAEWRAVKRQQVNGSAWAAADKRHSVLRNNVDYGRVKTTSVSVATTATYCLPFLPRYVIGSAFPRRGSLV